MISRDTLTTDLNVLDDFNPILPDTYKSSEFVMLGNLTPAIQQQVLDQLDDAKKPFVALDTMNFWMDLAMDELLKVISQVDALIINDEEARQLSGEFSLINAAQKIHKLGPKYLIIKRGEHGAFYFMKNRYSSLPVCLWKKLKTRQVQVILLLEDLWDTWLIQTIFHLTT